MALCAVLSGGEGEEEADAKLIRHAARTHSSIENTFREDDARLKAGHPAENFAVLRHVAFNLLKHHPAKLSLKRRR